MKPVVAGFSGVRGLRAGLVDEGSRGTVGKPDETIDKHIWSKYIMNVRV